MRICRRLLFTALALAALGAGPLAAAPGERRIFTGSVRELPAAQKATLHAMTAAHLGDAVGFNVPLALRNRDELEARVNRGEIIPGGEMQEKYLPLPADYDAVSAWLKGEGFAVEDIGDARLAVFARGTVAQVQASFQTTMGLITLGGADRAVVQAAPSLPATLAAPALGVSGLNFHRPHSRLVQPTASGDGTAQPRAVPSGGYHIKDIVSAYGGANLAVNGTTLTGAGQTIGIEAYVNVKSADLTKFWTANSVTRAANATVTTINVNNATLATDSGNVGENALDVEWASGIAPAANIVDYATNYDSNDAPQRIYNRALSDAMASGSTLHTFSSSYGPDEVDLTTTELDAYSNIFLSMTAAGLTYLNATGDYGSANTAGTDPAPEAYGDCPYATGVGGTSLQLTTATSGTRSTETGWSGSAGGYSKYFAQPAWQANTGVANATGKRMIPDLALDGDPNTGAYYVYNSKVGVVGGTSWSAPTFAGFLAMIQQGRALNTPARGALGFLNPRLYALIGTANFYDVTGGSNGAYSARAGYDLVTGVGVPTVNNLLTTWLGPTVTGFTPTGGAAGTTVTITGTNLYANTGYPVSVTFGGAAATSVTVAGSTQITAVVPGGAATGAVVVTSFGDAAASGMPFTVTAATAAPTVTSFTPTSGAVVTSVTITGTGFTGATAVSFGGAASANFTVNGPTQITATVPTGAVAGTVAVTTGAGTGTSTGTFTVTTGGGTTGAVVISQVYGGGSSSGAAYLNDYVELFNTGKAAINLSGYTVQYASASGTGGYTRIALSGSIPGQHYYLVQGAAGTAGTALPNPDTSNAALNMAATAGRIALVSNTNTITGATSAGVVDFVGYGTGASEHEGSGNAPAPSATTADFRANGGYTDTNNNAADFSLGTPNPRNSSMAPTPSQSWRYQYFGTTANAGDAADTANPSGDGLPNLVKYALGLDPLVPAANPVTQGIGTGYLSLSAPKNADATDLTYGAQVTDDPANPAGWDSTGATVDQNTSTLFQAHDRTPVGGTARRFIRLQISR